MSGETKLIATYRYILKNDLQKWLDKGWCYCKDLHVIGCIGMKECLIKKKKANQPKLG